MLSWLWIRAGQNEFAGMVITDSVPNAGERDFQPFRLRTQRQEQPQLSCAWACRYGRYPYSNDRGVRRMVLQVQLQQLQQEFAFSSRHGKPECPDMDKRFFASRTIPLQC
ncbi:MAG: hypothetical protein DMG41_18255 [Acidobacteria bacterium]|nr:MAG: hypothetical protein DMG41_18255 [Acidobacteriota bacterium]